MRKVSGFDLAVKSAVLLDGVDVTLPNCLQFSNLSLSDHAFSAMLTAAYKARTCRVDAVSLLRLPQDAALAVPSEEDFLVRVGDALVAEQAIGELGQDGLTLLSQTADFALDEPVIVLGRLGLRTWGHWLGELLPKAVCLEARYRGKFRYIVPPDVVRPHAGRSEWVSIRESLAFYGIEESQLVPVAAGSTLQLKQGFLISPVWSDDALHPGAASLLRDRAPACEPGARRSSAVLRTEVSRRNVENIGEVTALLQDKGFDICDLGKLSFAEQVTMFASSDRVVSVLGSGMTGLIYAPASVTAISLAPDGFADNFFYGIMQERVARYADLRGKVVRLNNALPRDSSFEIDLPMLGQAVDHLSSR